MMAHTHTHSHFTFCSLLSIAIRGPFPLYSSVPNYRATHNLRRAHYGVAVVELDGPSNRLEWWWWWWWWLPIVNLPSLKCNSYESRFAFLTVLLLLMLMMMMMCSPGRTLPSLPHSTISVEPLVETDRSKDKCRMIYAISWTTTTMSLLLPPSPSNILTKCSKHVAAFYGTSFSRLWSNSYH